jgi:hypothetical protein
LPPDCRYWQPVVVFLAVTELLEEVERVRGRAADLRGEARALKAQAAQARRQSEIATLEIDASSILRSLERLGLTLLTWNGVAPTGKEMVQWMDEIESEIATLEERIAQLRRGR